MAMSTQSGLFVQMEIPTEEFEGVQLLTDWSARLLKLLPKAPTPLK